MLFKPFASGLAALLLAAALPFPAMAMESYELSIKEHRFEPSSITIPSGVKVKLLIKNLDDSPEEFESYSLHREKLIPAGGRITVYIGPLDPGRYEFFGEFHSDTAKGTIIVE